MPYSDYERLAIPGGILDKLLGIEAPEMDTGEEPTYQGHDFIEGLAGMGQGMPPANTLAEGLLSGLSRGLGRQGTRLQTERKRFEEIAAERRKERDVANRQATKDYQRDRIQMLRDSSREQRDEGRRTREYERDNPEVNDELIAAYPNMSSLPRMKGQRIKRDMLQKEALEAPSRNAAAQRAQATAERAANAQERQARLAQAQTLNQLSDDYNKDPDIMAFRTATENLRTMREAAAQKSGVGDVALLISYVRATEPGVLSVVRQEELRNVSEAVGKLRKLMNIPNEWVSGQRLTDSGRQEILRAGQKIAESRKQGSELANTQYKRRAGVVGVDPTLFMREYSTTPAFAPQPGGFFDVNRPGAR